jgi:uncharacterized membrane protein affecting hemolysin expression
MSTDVSKIRIFTIAAIAAIVIMAFLILIIEIVLYKFLLKQHTKKKRAPYAATTNITSFFAGLKIMYAAI